MHWMLFFLLAAPASQATSQPASRQTQATSREASTSRQVPTSRKMQQVLPTTRRTVRKRFRRQHKHLRRNLFIVGGAIFGVGYVLSVVSGVQLLVADATRSLPASTFPVGMRNRERFGTIGAMQLIPLVGPFLAMFFFSPNTEGISYALEALVGAVQVLGAALLVMGFLKKEPPKKPVALEGIFPPVSEAFGVGQQRSRIRP